MGTFTIRISVGHKAGGELREMEVLVDTGATHTFLPQEVLRQMHIEPTAERQVTFADGEEATWPIGEARIVYGEEAWTCPVMFAPHDQRLLGATTLEAFNLTVDPVNQELVPAPLKGRLA